MESPVVTKVVVDTTPDPNKPVVPPALPSETDPNQPKLLAGKYKTPEELEKGYLELVKKLGEKAPPVPDPAQPPPPPQKKTDPLQINPQDAAQQAAQTAGLDMAKLNEEYQQTGQLSEESLAAFAKVGISKDIIDNYIAGQEALVAQQVTQVQAIVGGAENYGKMIQWAGANLSPAEITAFNAAMTAGIDSQKFAVEGLKARYQGAVGSDPSILKGDGSAAGNSDVYTSRAQVTTDMKDPRYAKDPAYRARVEAKLARSKF